MNENNDSPLESSPDDGPVPDDPTISEPKPSGEGESCATPCPSPTRECLVPPSTLLGRTLSASAVDYRAVWRSKKTAEKASQFPLFSNSADGPLFARLAGTKRKYSSQEYSTPGDACRLPHFVNSLPASTGNSPQMLRPVPNMASIHPEFVTPSQPKKLSRPNSPSSSANRPVLPRGRVASIRRESDCSSENEAAHEKLVKTAQQVSVGFEDFCLDDKLFEERKRAKSLTEPISILTNAFLPQSSSPSPTRASVDIQKQCYSPSTQQVVRSNISYSPSPSPTPGSPYSRMRSMSPIARQISKRRYTGSGGGGHGSNGGNGSGLESDGESSASSLVAPAAKRQCTTPRSGSNASPLVRDSTLHLQLQLSSSNSLHFTATSLAEPASANSQMPELYAASPVYSNASSGSLGASPAATTIRPRLLIDPKIIAAQCLPSSSSMEGDGDDSAMLAEEEGGPLMASFCSGAYDANSSTTFSSRANTPHSEMLDNSGAENELSGLILLPPQSSCSSDGSSQNSQLILGGKEGKSAGKEEEKSAKREEMDIDDGGEEEKRKKSAEDVEKQ